jgi:hypothetical protein
MADQIQVPTYEQIVTLLTKLATNYSNMAIMFYDIFYNEVPMDVTFQMYNEEGVIQTYTIPNRAKDRANILNGNGSPEGTVEANKGVIYQDLQDGKLYIKLISGGSTGWSDLISNAEFQNFLCSGNGSPEGVVEATTGVLYVDRATATIYIKSSDGGNTGWKEAFADISNLATRSLNNLTTTGENHFANPSLGNLNNTGKAKFNAKEDVANKVTSVTSASTDTQYPSAKATYDLINSELNHVVVEVGGTDSNWYRLYRDGWLEAGGYLTGGGTVNLIKPFSSIRYTLVPSSNATDFSKTTNSFTLTVSSNSKETDWVAYGWGAR